MTTVIWIDWYSYHISRFRALSEHACLQGRVTGIELVGGCGVHSGLRFREANRDNLPISSLFPDADWASVGQLKLAWAVWRQLNRLRPSSILVPGWYTAAALAAALWAKVHGKRSILMTETTESDYSRTWWKESLKRVFIRRLFDFGIAGGQPHVRYLTKLGFRRQLIGRFYDVVDNDFYREASDRLRLNPGLHRFPDEYFLYVGRLAPEKNILGCLREFAQYRKLGGTWSLVLVGDGPDRRKAEQLVKDLKLEQAVTFTGLKTATETTTYYAFAGCLILPSLREPWGLVVNEAMASGMPVLVSDRCGCAEDLVRPSQNGFLFDPKKEMALTEQMLKLSTSDPVTLREMGQKSREIIAEYSLARWATEVALAINNTGDPFQCEY